MMSFTLDPAVYYKPKTTTSDKSLQHVLTILCILEASTTANHQKQQKNLNKKHAFEILYSFLVSK